MPVDTDLLIIFPSMLLGLAMILRFLHARARLRSSDDVEELRTALHDLQLELEELRAEEAVGHAELHERIDFAERLLTARPREAEEEKEPTPV